MGLALVATGALALASGGTPGGRPAPRIAEDGPSSRPMPPAIRVGKIYFGNDGRPGRGRPQDRRGVPVPPPVQESAADLPRRPARRATSGTTPSGSASWTRSTEPRKLLDLDGAAFGRPPVWSADGSKLIVSLGNRKPRMRRRRITGGSRPCGSTPTAPGVEELKVPPEDGVLDWSLDGRLVTGLQPQRRGRLGTVRDEARRLGARQITEEATRSTPGFRPTASAALHRRDRRRNVGGSGSSAPMARVAASSSRPRSLPGLGLLVAGRQEDRRHRHRQDASADRAKAKLVIQEVDGEGSTEFPLDDVKQTDMPDWR